MCANEAFGADRVATGSDYPVLQDYEACTETFAYIERLDLPAADRGKSPHHNARARFAFAERWRRRSACSRGIILAYTWIVTAGQ